MAAYPAHANQDLESMVKATSSEVQRSWKEVLKLATRHGRVAVTHHRDTEAVVVSREEYERMHKSEVELAELKAGLESAQHSPVEELTRRFKERLASRDPEAVGASLRAAAASRTTLGGRLRVDDRY